MGPIGGFDPATTDQRAIVSARGGIRLLNAEGKIRQALALKGDRYGELDAPYLIVIADSKDELAGSDHNLCSLLDAVFGTVITVFTRHDDSRMVAHEERRHDGYWGVNGNARHTNVSGVLLLPKPALWRLRDKGWQPLIVRNPWAARPLPVAFFPLPSFEVTRAGEITSTEGQSFADILGLPARWPPEG